jgi:uncharacterized GH25 family protein
MRMIPVKRLLTPALIGLCLLGAVSLFAHNTWLSPAPSTVKAGEPVTVLLASGPAPAGSDCDAERWSSSYFLTWD